MRNLHSHYVVLPTPELVTSSDLKVYVFVHTNPQCLTSSEGNPKTPYSSYNGDNNDQDLQFTVLYNYDNIYLYLNFIT